MKRVVLALGLCLAALTAKGQTETVEVVPLPVAWSRFSLKWDEFRVQLGQKQTAAAKKSLESALAAKWDGGLGDLPLPGLALVRWAEQMGRQGEPETADWLVQMALKLAPRSCLVHLALGRYYLGGGPFSPQQSLAHYLLAVKLLKDDLPCLYRTIGRLCMIGILFLGGVGGAFGIIMVLRYGKLLAHDFGDFLGPLKLHPLLVQGLLGLGLFFPLAAGLSPWWLLAWWLVVLSLYLKRPERVVVYVWLIGLATAPWLIERYSVFAGTRSDETLQAALRVRNGVPESGDRKVLEEALDRDPDDALSRFSLAQLLTRGGNFSLAVATYGPSLENPRTAQEAYNNLAEIYFAVGDLESVFRALSAAAERGPGRVEIFFNLGQYYNESEKLIRMEEEFKTARELDEKRMEELQARSGPRRLNRMMASLGAPWSLVWNRSVRGSGLASAAEAGLWSRLMGAPDGAGFLAGLGSSLLIMILLAIFGRRWRLAFRCASCGQPVCLRCQRPAKDPGICSPCYYVFRGESGVELKVKMSKRAEVQHYRDRLRRVGLALTVALPGSGHLLRGRTGLGLVFLVGSVLMASAYLSGFLVWPDPGPSYRGGMAGPWLVLGLGYLVLVLISTLLFWAQSEV